MSRALAIRVLAALALALQSLQASAQTAMKRLEARVTAVSGASVYLDQGTDAGIEPGDRVLAHPSGGGTLAFVVRSVSRQSARCETVDGTATIEIGALVEVLVPDDRASGGAQAPEHPPWTQPEKGWDPDVPLLAPAESLTPAERERDFSGRWYTGLDFSTDNVGDRQSYVLARAGLDATLDNAFGHGDVVRFDGEFFQRGASLDNSSDASDSHLRIDRLSWRIGDWRDRASRLEVGRFLHSEMPQLGIVDGVEYVRRTDGGDHFGASVGFLPEWTAEQTSGEDLETSLFYRHTGGEAGELSIGGALQKSWHQGNADRDLAVGDLSWRPNERWWLATAAWVDWYDASDDPKSSGPELTEMHANVSYRASASSGTGVSASHVRWPVLLRNELPPTTVDTLADGQVDRVGANAWHDLTKKVRLSGRVDRWASDADQGLGGELRVGWRDLLFERGEIAAALFSTDGEFSSATGLRLSGSRWGERGTATLVWEFAEHEQQDFTGDSQNLLQQLVRGSWDVSFWKDWDLSISLDARFGDEQDGQTLGFWLQRRF